ncbi:MAG: lysophospholipid acyltransferase family protein [Phycisphaerales bacterium]
MSEVSTRVTRRPVAIPRPSAAWARALVDAPLRMAERAFKLDAIEAMASAVEQGDPSRDVMERVMEVTRLSVKATEEDLARIPAKGGVLLCANHPFGGADSTALLAAARRRRSDVKFLTNGIMSRFPFLEPCCIFVDPFGGEGAVRRNAAAIREALAWLKAGHVLGAFPAGEVSASSWGQWTPADPPWSTIPARLALSAGAKIVPVWFEGTNSSMFHALGLVHPRLRTALLPSEFVARCGTEIELRIGRAIATEGSGLDPESMTRLVRGRCELLRRHAPPPKPEQVLEPLGGPLAGADEIAAELAALPAEALLVREGDYDVYMARAAQIRRTLPEIGRLREIAFRAVGEGSGKTSDTDRFDETYWQLVVWNRAKREIVGGYRAGVVAEVTKDAGIAGLYTSTLFEYSPRIASELGDAIELGRSYVRPEYQRQPLPLSLLWKAIGVFMFRGGHRRMFGPVSISNDYTSMSKELIMEFLERHRMAAPFAKLVTPRNPPARRGVAGWTSRETAEATADITHVERLVDEIERGERAVPVLLRQYLRLNAQLLAFNVDHEFGDVVDALMLVDLAQIDERIMRYYLGDESYALMKQQLAGG